MPENETPTICDADGSLDYWHRSRTLAHGLLAVLPLLVLYQLGAVQAGFGERSLIEVWVAGGFRRIGRSGIYATQVLNVAVLITIVAMFWNGAGRGRPSPTVLVLMIAESCLYALLLHRAGTYFTRLAMGTSMPLAIGWTQLSPYLLGIGAAVYEELAFRLLLLGGGTLALTRLFLWPKTPTCLAMLVVSSVLFSLVHHIGDDQIVQWVFVFRTVCGALLGALFLARGFGIAAWSHAIYNLMIMYQAQAAPPS
jgi:CAAX prenyl protease-like protein